MFQHLGCLCPSAPAQVVQCAVVLDQCSTPVYQLQPQLQVPLLHPYQPPLQLQVLPHLIATVFQQCPCPCINTGSSDVTATSTTAATASRRLLQTSTENIGLNITLPAGTNITQAIATLTAASGNGTGTLLTAAQQAYVSAVIPL